MKPFQIFKPGKHTAASGQVIEFTEDMLRAAVEAYDPTLHEAPIVVGHPRANGPAYGWIKSLSFDEAGAIVADTQQVEAEFSEMVAAGRFKKRSASWYLPDAPNNPKPGALYLRHVGFLGAQPPAIKGLKEVEFGEAEQGVVEFSEGGRWAFSNLADVLRNLREWLIADKGMEAADKVVPAYAIDSVNQAASERDDDESKPAVMAAYSEGETMTIEELKAQVAALTKERDALKAKEADFGEQDTALKAREAAVATAEAQIARAAVEARVDAAVKAGRLLPAQRAGSVNFAMSLGAGEAVVEFGEGDKAEKLTQREAYLRQVEAAPVLVNYSELAPAAAGGEGQGASDPQAVADKARDLVKARASEGKTLSFTEAVAEVMTTPAA
jgi:hypothetical protein